MINALRAYILLLIRLSGSENTKEEKIKQNILFINNNNKHFEEILILSRLVNETYA